MQITERIAVFILWTGCIAGLFQPVASAVPIQIDSVATSANGPVLSPGQSATLLPSGQVLLIGGIDENRATNTISLRDLHAGVLTHLPASLNYARAGHTATLLPDGTVLIFGGVGQNREIVAQAELFDPETSRITVVSLSQLTARAFHTATLLVDGRLLITGGVSASGAVLDTAQLWDFRTSQVTNLVSHLSQPRRSHTATIMPDGRVALAEGLGTNNQRISSMDIYDPHAQQFYPSATLVSQSGSEASMQESIPPDGSTDVPLNALVGLRFSSALQVESVSSKTVTMTGREGLVPVKVVPAESGILVFLMSSTALLPGSIYQVTIAGSTDTKGHGAQFAQITFTTAGSSADIANAGLDSSRFDARWSNLSPLQAPPGVTALSGQTLQLNGQPLRNVTFQIDNVKVKSDDTGRFLLTNISPGHHAMLINGHTADTRGRTYGIYEVGVDVVAGRTTVLRYKIWMTVLDMAHAVNIPSPTTSEVIVSTPLLPGLELHIPPGTTITDHDNHIVRQVSITPIPLDKPPFPLPKGVDVPIYFTIQPGSAYIWVKGKGPKGAQLFYPNQRHWPNGMRFNFWNYDADSKGWYVYGQGTVRERQIIPDPNVVIYEFTGAMVADPGEAPPSGPPPGGKKAGDPVDLATGLFVYETTDLVLPDVIPIKISRSYRQGDGASREFGVGTTISYDTFLVGDRSGQYQWAELVLPDGGRLHYPRISGGTDYASAVFQHTASPTKYFGSLIKWNGNGWTLTLKDGTQYIFPDGAYADRGSQAALIGIQDTNGNKLTISRDGSGNIQSITSPNGRWVQFTTDIANARIMQITDMIGRTVKYNYDASDMTGHLHTVTDLNGGITTYNYYSGTNNMQNIQDPRGIVYLQNHYDANDRVDVQTLANNGTYTFIYTLSGPNVTQTTMTDPRGYVRQTAFTAPVVFSDGFLTGGYVSSDIYAQNQPEQQTFTYNIVSGTNLLQSVTDPLNRVTYYTYDSMANTTSVTRLYGTSNAVTTSYSYDPVFNRITQVTDPLNHSTNYTYDASANLISIKDAIGHTTQFSYDAVGNMLSTTDPMGHVTQFGYSVGDLVSVTDPTGKITNRYLDVAGRLLETVDPLGNSTSYVPDNLNRVTQTTDSLGNITSFGYDPNSNLTSVTDANHNQTTYQYDNMDRVYTRTDALTHGATYLYDKLGNLTQYTDRRGKIAIFNYDGLNRITFAGYGKNGTTYESTVSYTYDAGNRVQTLVDSIAGTITNNFDLLDNLTSQTTPQGSVSYKYDAAGRRASNAGMTVAGQTAVGYTFDNANRLTKMTQGSSTVTIGYNAANLRTSLTLPNGVVGQYAYDTNSHLTGLTYKLGSTVLGNLSYGYDAAGRRNSVGGTFAGTGLPAAVSSATYNADNEIVRWGSTTVSYDANGNVLSDGTLSYTWDARNRLSSITGGHVASFTYDAAGRRTLKTIDGTQVGFLYDGVNVIQEAITPTIGNPYQANLLTSLDVDEVFARTDTQGIRALLSDALGSTVALTDSTGTIQTQYTYEPFGNTTLLGNSSSNTFEFTGRENDPTGLYYYRSRYYHPAFQRFVSEDPIGLWGGDLNLHAYVSDDPIEWFDSLGLSRDYYVPDSGSHGGPHVDRYNPAGQNVGRYTPDGAPIKHKGRTPPPIPKSDQEKFDTAAKKLRKPQGNKCEQPKKMDNANNPNPEVCAPGERFDCIPQPDRSPVVPWVPVDPVVPGIPGIPVVGPEPVVVPI